MLPTTYSIQARDGKLFVVEKAPNHYDPYWDILWWPTGLSAAHYEHFVGKKTVKGMFTGEYKNPFNNEQGN